MHGDAQRLHQRTLLHRHAIGQPEPRYLQESLIKAPYLGLQIHLRDFAIVGELNEELNNIQI
jgi:hypothetical protein